MNKERRKSVRDAMDLIEQGKEAILAIAEEEREYYENMPENMQEGEKGTRASEIAESLEDLEMSLDEIINTLEEACN